jgi:type I restriction enzyme S subunit
MKSKKAVSVLIESLPDGENLPEGWKSIILEDYVYIAARIGWRGLKREEYTKTGPLFLAVKDIQENGAIDFQNVTDHLSEFRYDESTEIQLKNQDIIITKDGTIGKIGFVENLPGKVTVNSSLLVVRPSPEILPRFLFFYFRSPSFQKIVHDRITGSAVPHLFQKDIKKFRILVPPLSEQQRIVARIEALLTHVNSARDRLSRVPLIMKKFRQVVLAAACSGRLTEGWRDKNSTESVELTLQKIHVKASKTGREATDNVIPGDCILSVGDPKTPYPDGWLRVPLQQIAHLESGHTPSRKHPEYWDGDVSWIGIHDAHIHHGGYISKTLQHVTPLGLENSVARLLPLNTVCLSRTASVGYVVIMKSSMATSQDFVNWLCSEALLPKFLMYALMAEGEGIKKFGRGTTHTTIYYPEVKALHICLPPIAEQHEIVRRIEALFDRADAIEREVVVATKRCERLTQAVLGKAFSGELTTHDSKTN